MRGKSVHYWANLELDEWQLRQKGQKCQLGVILRRIACCDSGPWSICQPSDSDAFKSLGGNAERFYASLDHIRQDASSAVEYFGQYSRNTKVKLSNFSDQRLQMSTSRSLLRSFLGGGCIWLTNGDKTTCFLKAGVSISTFSPQTDTGRSPTSWSMTRGHEKFQEWAILLLTFSKQWWWSKKLKMVIMTMKATHRLPASSTVSWYFTHLETKYFTYIETKYSFHLKQNISL